MTDWQELVRERFAQDRSGMAIEPEVSEELAHYLEDFYEASLNNGLGEHEAAQCALAEVRNWPRLARNINFARDGGEILKQRIRTLWMPGLVATITAFTALFGMDTGLTIFFPAPKTAMFVYASWLVILSGIGALAAYWSRRAGGSVFARVTAALLPASGLVAALVIVFIGSMLAHDHLPASRIVSVVADSVVGGILVPAIALLVGALPFLREKPVERPLPAGMA